MLDQASDNDNLLVLIEDSDEFAYFVQRVLEREGYVVKRFRTGNEGLSYCSTTTPDLIIVDIVLPDLNGIEVCRKVKTMPSLEHCPVVMLSGSEEDFNVINSFEVGASDFIGKSSSIPVIVTRISRFLRQEERRYSQRTGRAEKETQVICPETGEQVSPEENARFTYTELRILTDLIQARGDILSRAELIAAAHGEKYHVTNRTVDVHVANLRRKLGSKGAKLQTVRGHGYRWITSTSEKTTLSEEDA